jgi:hypothetical protein
VDLVAEELGNHHHLISNTLVAAVVDTLVEVVAL